MDIQTLYIHSIYDSACQHSLTETYILTALSCACWIYFGIYFSEDPGGPFTSDLLVNVQSEFGLSETYILEPGSWYTSWFWDGMDWTRTICTEMRVQSFWRIYNIRTRISRTICTTNPRTIFWSIYNILKILKILKEIHELKIRDCTHQHHNTKHQDRNK